MSYSGQVPNPGESMKSSLDEDQQNKTDLTLAHQQKQDALEQQSLIEQFNQMGADTQPAAPQTATQPTVQNQAQETQVEEGADSGNNNLLNAALSAIPGARVAESIYNNAGTSEAVAKDVGTGAIQAPLQIVGGAVDAINNTYKMTQDIADWLNKNVADLGAISWDDDGIHFTSGKSVAGVEQGKIPTTDEATSETGKAIRSISQFITGFALAGKVLGPVGAAGKVATVAKGALTDFSAFDPSQQRLSDVIQQVPALQNPVTDFLSSKPGDSAVEGRVKNALEGLGLGVVSDGFIKGLRGMRELNAAKQAAAKETGQVAAPMIEKEPIITHEDIAKIVNGGEAPTQKAAVDANRVYKSNGKQFINWARIDSDDDVKQTIQDMADRSADEVETARRGTQSFEETKMNAQALDAWNVLTSRGVNQGLNAEQTLAARQLWTSSGDNVTRLAKEAQLNPSAANMFALRKAMTVHRAIQNQVIAARTETARALSSWRIPAGGTRLSELSDLMDNMGGDKVNQAIAKKISMLADNGRIKEMDEFVRQSAWSKTSDAVAQAWINGMLSSPHTHIRNFISQTATIGQQLYERKAAQLMSQAFGYDSEIPTGEVGHMLNGITSGLRNAFTMSANSRDMLKQATKEFLKDPENAKQMVASDDELGTVWKAMFTGESGYGVGKVDTQRAGAFSAETWEQDNNSVLGKALNFIDTVTQLPGRALGVSDEMFKTIGYRMELQARASQMAADEVASGAIKADGLKDRIADIIENPPQDLQGHLQDFSKYITFQDTPENTKVWGLWKAAARFPVLGKIVLPFSRTPYNIARYSFERSPLAPFVQRWRDDFAAGGARKEMAVARMATGSAIMLTMADLAMRGHITGDGPDNAGQRQALARMGVQRNSIKIPFADGDRYFSYTGIDPISTPMLLASNIVDILNNSEPNDDDPITEKAILAATIAIANQVTSAQYMSGVSNFFSMMHDANRYGESWVQKLVSSTVPSGVNYVNQISDPYARYAFDLVDSIKAKTPGLSKDLPVRRDLWGRPIDYRSGLGSVYDFISPIYSTKANAQPIDKEMNRLQLYIPLPNKTMTMDGVSIDLRNYPKAYSRYIELAGNELKSDQYGVPIDPLTGKGLMGALNDLVTGKSPMSVVYNMGSDGPDGDKAAAIRNMVTKYRTAAKQELLKEFPDLKAEYNAKVAKARANSVYGQ